MISRAYIRMRHAWGTAGSHAEELLNCYTCHTALEQSVSHVGEPDGGLGQALFLRSQCLPRGTPTTITKHTTCLPRRSRPCVL